MFCNRTTSKRPSSAFIEHFQKLCGSSFFNETAQPGPGIGAILSRREIGSELSSRNFAVLEVKDHDSSDDCAISTQHDSCLGDSQSFQSRDPRPHDSLFIHSAKSSFSTLHMDREKVSTDMFKTGNSQSTLLPLQEASWSADPGLFNLSASFEQHMQPRLSANNYTCEPSLLNSGRETWNDSIRSLSQSGTCQSSEYLETPWTQTLSLNSTKTCHNESETFRFRTCLQAPTSMVSDLGEKPETYLNKGQIYYLRIIDTVPPTPDNKKTTYRTFVTVSLKEQDQQMNAEAYWRLWEVRRALHNLDETDLERRAVEYADKQRPWAELTEEFLNGFSVTWTSDSLTSLNECHIPVRFNFLSTDFTLAKGVKGLSARLCVKTDQVNTTALPYQPEVCSCKIRIFRDHGAERKQSNDVANVKKKIKKLTEKATTSVHREALKRRRRDNPVAGKMKQLEAADLSLTNNAWSTEPHELKASIFPDELELQKKLVKLRKMLLSSCPESVLSLRGGREDDPETQTIRLQFGCNSTPEQCATTSDGSLRGVSLCFNSPDHIQDNWLTRTRMSTSLRRSPTPTSCFYISNYTSKSSSEGYYRAIYLRQRTALELTQRICEKLDVETSKISRILHTDGNNSGFQILVDDDFVQRMMDYQGKIVKIEDNPRKEDSSGSTAVASLQIQLEFS